MERSRWKQSNASLYRAVGAVEDSQMTNARRAGATSAATLFGLALTIVFAHAIAPEWIRRAGLDVWNLPSAIADSQTADQQLASLNAQEEQLFQEITLGDSIIAQITAGSLSLEAAVDEMEPIMRNRSGFAVTVQQYYGVSSFRQGVALYLISRLPRIISDPVQRAAVRTHLEREYARIK
jgi:hypothetical protein